VWEGEYLPFGEVYSVTGSVDNNLRFPGQYYDAETGLHYNYFRDYKPVIGRYVEADPIGFASGDMTLYAYVGNNPVNRVDPWGLWGEDVHSGIGNPNYGTYLWAREMGFSDAAARIIANANNATDNYANWAVVFGVPGRHFNTGVGSADTRDIFARFDLQLAADIYNQGDVCDAFSAIGRGLHSIQDKVAHGDWPFYVVHPPWFDDPSQRPDALEVTEFVTKRYLLDFLGRIKP
jgi:RHS repeat-associated protein